MKDIVFDRLTDLPLREAWSHEAHDFTPWLADNIDHLSDVIGVPLELTGTEVRVEKFAADILARNQQDDSVVLIENQLEETNHAHLGQIMTYLAGLEAQTVVWIAPDFREPHRSAIRWLNEHTSDGFSFFAVRLRVVRIGDSPLAPIFEIVEKPDQWTRAITRKKTNAQSEAANKRRDFWALMLERHPTAARQGISVSGNSYMTMPIVQDQLQLGRYVSAESSGVYLRSPTGIDPQVARDLLGDKLDRFLNEADAKLQPEGSWACFSSCPHSLVDEKDWQSAVDFLHDKTQQYLSILDAIFPDR